MMEQDKKKKEDLNKAKNIKVYKPNLNVQRNKPTQSVTGAIKKEVTPKLTPAAERRHKGRGKAVIQQNQGIFAEGLPEVKGGQGRGRETSGEERLIGGRGDATDNMPPTLKMEVDEKTVEDRMKQLLTDDYKFSVDPKLEPDFKKCPFQINSPREGLDGPGLRKKSDTKPVDKKENITINDIFLNPSKSDPGFLMLQLPTTLPGLNLDIPDVEPTTSKATAKAKRVTLSSLPPGQIGKVQILKSGKARLVLGKTTLLLEMGTQVSFKQEVVSAQLDEKTHTGDLISLGPVDARMIVVPDWESMLSNQ